MRILAGSWQGLRGRLFLGSVALLTAGLLIADATALLALRSFLADRVDDTLIGLRDTVQRQARTAPTTPVSWSVIGALAPAADYVAFVSPAGQTVVARNAVSGRQTLSPPQVPQPVTAAPDEPFTAPSETGDGRYRMSVIRLPGNRSVVFADGTAMNPTAVIVGVSLVDNAATVRQLLLVEAASTLFIQLLGAVTAWAILRIGLRPLRTVADTARAIAGGHRDQRIPVDQPHTEIGQVATSLNEAFQQRQAAEDRIRQFVADASHELRTPLTTIRGWTDHYLNGGITAWEQADTAVERIDHEAARMQHLVEDLLLLARLDAHRPLAHEPVDLTAIARGIVADLNVIDPDRPITLTIPGTPAIVAGDATTLTQVLHNLVGNAVRHTPPVTPIEIDVTTGVHDGHPAMSVVVRDHGPGMEPEALQHAFERFWRADTGRTANGGTGLGLSIAREITEAHGGTLTLHSTPGAGLTARWQLPATTSGPTADGPQ